MVNCASTFITSKAIKRLENYPNIFQEKQLVFVHSHSNKYGGMTILVAKFKNKREADAMAVIISALSKKINVLKGEHWDDFYMAQMIDEGMKEKGSVSIDSIRKKLRK